MSLGGRHVVKAVHPAGRFLVKLKPQLTACSLREFNFDTNEDNASWWRIDLGVAEFRPVYCCFQSPQPAIPAPCRRSSSTGEQ